MNVNANVAYGGRSHKMWRSSAASSDDRNRGCVQARLHPVNGNEEDSIGGDQDPRRQSRNPQPRDPHRAEKGGCFGEGVWGWVWGGGKVLGGGLFGRKGGWGSKGYVGGCVRGGWVERVRG